MGGEKSVDYPRLRRRIPDSIHGPFTYSSSTKFTFATTRSSNLSRERHADPSEEEKRKIPRKQKGEEKKKENKGSRELIALHQEKWI